MISSDPTEGRGTLPKGQPSAVLGKGSSRRTSIRYLIVGVLFVATTINYADRATLGVVGPRMSADLGLNPQQMGWLLSAFSWAYVVAQLPGGWLLDRFGSKRVYAWSLGIWSATTLLQAAAGLLTPGVLAISCLFGLRLLLGLGEAPSFPANGRIVATWFPTAERGLASAIFNAAQYAATIIFSPIMGTLADRFGWPSVFAFMGCLGLGLWAAWPFLIHAPRKHPWVNQAEVDYIEQGGGLVDIDQAKRPPFSGRILVQLLKNRMLLGIYLGQYCINVLTFFFITWFPIYLVKSRGMTILHAGFFAALTALFGLIGGLLGGFVSDWLLRRGWSLTAARKVPIVTGLLLSVGVVGCNYVSSPAAITFLICLSYFGKGIGSLGWALIADVSPKEITGLSGAVFNTFGNASGIVTPIAIGYIIGETGSFNGALVFVGLHAVLGVLSFLLVVGKIERITLKHL